VRRDDRRERILELVREHRRVSVDRLSANFGTSPETIRRDLADLARQGLLRKFHGGASLPDPAASAGAGQAEEGSFQLRLTQFTAEKCAIARRAARLFRPGETLFIDAGSTTLAFAEELVSVPKLTVITNAIGIAQAAATRGQGCRAFLLGGEVDPEVRETLGALVLEQIRRFHTAHVVLTVGAITPQGIFDFSVEETEVARAMIGQAASLTVLADSSKFDRTGLFQVAPLARLQRLVTDRAPNGAVAEALAEAGVEVIVAG